MKTYKYDNILISFNEEPLLEYIKIHLKNSTNETGGALSGYYTQDKTCAVITEFLKPSKDSIFKRTSFIRGFFGLKETFKQKWSNGEYYLGDWHLHPYSAPIASKQDISQAIHNSKDDSLNCPEPIMVIVGGENNNKIRVYVCFDGNVEECIET